MKREAGGYMALAGGLDRVEEIALPDYIGCDVMRFAMPTG